MLCYKKIVTQLYKNVNITYNEFIISYYERVIKMVVGSNDVYKIYLEPFYVHNRIATADWSINSFKMQAHNIVYIYDGKGIFDNGGGKTEVKSGDLVYFGPGARQFMTTDPKTPLKLFTVNFYAAVPRFYNSVWSIEPANFGFSFVNSLEDEAVQNRFTVLFQRLCHLFPLADSVRKGRDRETLNEILALAEICRGSSGISFGVRDKINRAVHYMTDNYGQKLSLSSLAAEAELSPSYFSAVFREITGKSPIDYLIHLRIYKAKQFLSDGFSVTAAAEETGFSDIYYFSNVFKRLEGVSPVKFKSKQQKEQE